MSDAIKESVRNLFSTIVMPDVWYTPEVVCNYCHRNLYDLHRQRKNKSPSGQRKSKYNYIFVGPVVWLERSEHRVDSCYFCVSMKRARGMHYDQRFEIRYAEVESVIAARRKSDEIPNAPALDMFEPIDESLESLEPMEVTESEAELFLLPQQPSKRTRESELPSTSQASTSQASTSQASLSQALLEGAPVVRGLSFETATTVSRSGSGFELTPSEVSVSSNITLITQAYFNDIVRDMGASLRGAEILASRLKQCNVTAPDFKITSGRKGDERQKYAEFYNVHKEDNFELVFCADVNGLFGMFGIAHVPNEWRLFIDGSTQSLKAVLLHNGNVHPSIPIAYALNFKETYENMETLLDNINWNEHEWQICSDLKIVGLLSGSNFPHDPCFVRATSILFLPKGLKGGYAQYQCFICEFEGRKDVLHYIGHKWKLRQDSVKGEISVVNDPLVPKDKIILPPLHIKLGIVRNFIVSLKLTEGSDLFKILKDILKTSSQKTIAGSIFLSF